MAKVKTPRIQKRANKEIGIVKICGEKYDDKISELEMRQKDAKLFIDQLKTDIVNTQDQTLARKLCNKKNMQEMQLKNRELLITKFNNTENLLEMLLNMVELLYAQEMYKYIVKVIPEKRLPKMVRDPNLVDAVYDLVNGLIKEFYESIKGDLVKYQKGTEEWTRLSGVMDNFDSLLGNNNAKADREIERLRAEAAMQQAQENNEDDDNDDDAPAYNR